MRRLLKRVESAELLHKVTKKQKDGKHIYYYVGMLFEKGRLTIVDHDHASYHQGVMAGGAGPGGPRGTVARGPPGPAPPAITGFVFDL